MSVQYLDDNGLRYIIGIAKRKATNVVNGLMSKEDKIKIDSISVLINSVTINEDIMTIVFSDGNTVKYKLSKPVTPL